VTTKENPDVAEDLKDDDVDEATGTADVADEGEESAETETQGEPRDSAVRRTLRGARSKLGAILLAAALIASAGVAAWLYFYQYRPDQQTNDAAATVALEAAKSGTVSLLSYSPESLDKDFANAKSHLTGDFLSYYTQFTEKIVAPAAKQKSVKTTASVVRAAVSELQPDSAVVLVFINQNTTSKENPDGAFAASSVKVGMEKINGAWLISAFDPV
jgi:Mce-associated membrane protein